MLACWSIKGGVGTTTVVAGLARALGSSRAGRGVLLVDLAGDLPVALGVEAGGRGIAEWLAAGPDVPADALHRLEVAVAPGVALLPRGHGPFEPARVPGLAAALADQARWVVVDAGVLPADDGRQALVAAAGRTLLITRACPLATARLVEAPLCPSGVVVVRDHGRAGTAEEVGTAAGAPVVAEIDVDPAVGRAVDAGLAHRRPPRGFLRALGAVA